MNKEQALERLTALEDEAKKLREILEAPEKKERWRASKGNTFYYIFHSGEAVEDTDDYSSVDMDLLNQFNYFQTKEEAERIARVQLAYRKLDWAIRQFELVSFNDIGYDFNLNKDGMLESNRVSFKTTPFPLLRDKEGAVYILSNYKAELLTFLTGGEK